MDHITRLMIHLGCDPSLIGFDFARTGIRIYMEARRRHQPVQMMRDIYGAIAQDAGITATRVERTIRSTVERMVDYGNIPEVQRLFGALCHDLTAKPTNSTFLATLAEVCLGETHKGDHPMTADTTRAFDRGPVCRYERVDQHGNVWQCRSCGHLQRIEADGPYEDGMDFCPGCGRLIASMPDFEEEESDG